MQGILPQEVFLETSWGGIKEKENTFCS